MWKGTGTVSILIGIRKAFMKYKQIIIYKEHTFCHFVCGTILQHLEGCSTCCVLSGAEDDTEAQLLETITIGRWYWTDYSSTKS